MKRYMKTSLTLLLTALLLAGVAACGKTGGGNTAPTTEVIKENSEATELEDDTGTGNDADTQGTVEPTDATGVGNNTDIAAGMFKATELVLVGEHTYYPADLFDQNDRDRDYKDHMIEQLQEADKEIHDDIYVYGIGESEVRGEFRFFGKMMKDGVIFDTADMTCWYDEGAGSHWEINSRFRRTDFSKIGLMDAEKVFNIVYENASKSEKALKVGKGQISGTYDLVADADGRVLYRFTVNKYSTVDVDAKTGEIVSEHYWDGIFT